MKNLTLIFWVFCVVLMSIVPSSMKALEFGGGTDVAIAIDKTGTNNAIFSIPDQYFDADGFLIVPLDISIHKADGTLVFSTITKNKTVDLTGLNLPCGTYMLYVELGMFNCKTALSF